MPFRSLNEGAIDTTNASGELILNIFSALAQFERRLIQERTKAGLVAARAFGRKGGRPKTSPKEAKVKLAKSLMADKSIDLDEICKTLKISRSTLYRYANFGRVAKTRPSGAVSGSVRIRSFVTSIRKTHGIMTRR